MSAAAAWEALVRGALLGTGRQPAPDPAGTGDPALDGALAALADRPAEARVLQTAALLDAWRRAGVRAPRSAARPPPPAPEGEERPCPPVAARVLRQLLGSGQPALLAEWMALARPAGAAPPHELLPAVLEYARRHPETRDAVAAGVGARGRWLAALNPEWTFSAAAPDDPAQAWETGTFDQRLAALRHLRATDPAAGLALLRTTWADEPPRERAAFAEALATGLGMDDEPFLESALDDRRKEVRTAAATLLSSLPGSALVRRMTERLVPLLELRTPEGLLSRIRGGAAKLQVRLPEACDKAMRRDGIEPRPIYGFGERAWWLHQMVAAVPPAFWTAHWGRSAAELLAVAQGSEDGALLVNAWTQAALRARDAEWAEARLRASGRDDRLGTVEPLAAVLPPERLEPLAVERIRAGGLKGPTAGGQMLQAARFAWSPALTHAVLAAFPRALSQGDYYPRELLRATAPYMHPATAVSVLRQQGDPHEGPWVDLVHLRHTLHQAFS